VSRPLHTVHVRVNDAATGQPTPVRISFTGSDGQYYAPFGRLARIDEKAIEGFESIALEGNLLLDEPAAYIDGNCEIALPPGPITVDIRKGFEYRPIHTVVDLPSGKMALRFNIERWIDLRADHWYSGDIAFWCLTPHAALLEGAAEDVAVVNLLASKYGNLVAFSGQRPALEIPGHMVVVNTFNTHPILGCLALLNCHRIVFPLTFGAPDGPDDWTLADWCDQCHRKGGLVVWSSIGGAYWGGEALADFILGKVDAVALPLPFEKDLYALLDCNLRIACAAGCGKFNHVHAVGEWRTYARLLPGDEFTYKNWIEAIRSGRTFVTNGPLLDFTVNGRDSGSALKLPAGSGQVQIHAQARSWELFERLEIVVNGKAVAAVEASGIPYSAIIDGHLDITESGWLAARCIRDQRILGGDEHACIAHTSPIYLQVPGKPHAADPIHLAYLTDKLNQMLNWAESGALYENDKQREHLTSIFKNASTELVRLAGGGPRPPEAAPLQS
jgi:hypothetical protein